MTIKYFVQFALLVLFFGACQKEENQTNISPNAIVVNSPLAKLIARTCQNPTECDNVLDKNSCFSIKLPVTVVVNSQSFTVTTKDDYQLVQYCIDDYTTDDDIIHFNFPITVQFKNFSTQVVNNDSQLHDVAQACGQDDGFNEIDCIAINYPVSINIYDTNNQVANTIAIQNNPQLYTFISNLSNGVIAAIVYPISVTDSNGQNVIISSNMQLETLIDSSIADCEDYSGGPNPTFLSTINSGSWYVSYFYHDQNETYHYNGYNFTFVNNGTISVIKNAITSNGNWSTYVDNGQNKFDLNFVNSNLHELEEDWIIIEYTQTTIHLKHISGGGGEIHYLYFTKS